ncbi:MAG TPA: three-Cys-motif partner protein TcmP [Nitrospirae bacterium]|nr:three-Cys-motif partner protein TcmP [Nitrospirota bacterium]
MKLDEINYWSEVKLDIIKDYAKEYSKILSVQSNPKLYHIYIDAFAGAGVHISKATGEFVPGSPMNALLVTPPFKEYHLIDLDSEKIDLLKDAAKEYANTNIYEGDCNSLLIEKVFPRAKYEDYKRALCLLDPYGLHLNWDVMYTAGQMKSIEIFLNFPMMDMNMNVLWNNPSKVDPQQAARMTAFWGDESWRDIAYDTTGNLFGFEEKTGNASVAEAFRQRLMKVAGFSYVPQPMPMRNSKEAVVYYLFFASQKPQAEDIVTYIFNKYKDRGIS